MKDDLLPIIDQRTFLPISTIKLHQNVEHEADIDWCLNIKEETCSFWVEA